MLAAKEKMPKVELLCAGVPFLSALAVHYWFVSFDSEGNVNRWEVWHCKNAGLDSNGHLNRNLKRPNESFGGSKTKVVHIWEGDSAVSILRILNESWNCYPYKKRYFPIPGPNSNTYVAWVLQQAGIDFTLSRKGIGRNFLN